jgi:ATP-dependent Lhr-like helicase
VKADVTTLDCDAWLCPTDERFKVNAGFGKPLGLSEDGFLMGYDWGPRRAIPADHHQQHNAPLAVLGDVGRLTPTTPEEVTALITDLLPVIREFVKVAVERIQANTTRRPLRLALPLIGTGHGGLSGAQGDTIKPLLDELDKYAKQEHVDFVLCTDNKLAWSAHHSSLSRELRLDVETRMQKLPSAVCVATSTLELGIDIGDVDLVILYGAPFGWESFLQRIGRGNRRGDKSNVLCLAVPGKGPTFAQQLYFEALIWQVREQRLEQRPATELYGAVAQQLLSLLLERSGGYQRVAQLSDVFSPWPHLPREVIDEILAALQASDYVRAHGFQNRVGAGPQLHKLWDLGAIWGNFPASSITMPLRASGREIGAIPILNLGRLRPGVLIRFAGRRWRVAGVRRDGIHVETAPGGGNEIEILYRGLRPAMDASNVEAMLLLLLAGVSTPQMTAEDGERFVKVIDRLRRHLAPGVIPVASDSGRLLYFTFGGQLLNKVIAIHSGSSGYRAGEIVLESVDPIDFSQLPSDPRALLPIVVPILRDPMGLTVFQQLLPGTLLDRELAELWLKTPVQTRSLSRLRQSDERSVPLAELQEINF